MNPRRLSVTLFLILMSSAYYRAQINFPGGGNSGGFSNNNNGGFSNNNNGGFSNNNNGGFSNNNNGGFSSGNSGQFSNSNNGNRRQEVSSRGSFGCCRPAVECSPFLLTSSDLRNRACTLADNSQGYCCDESGSQSSTSTTARTLPVVSGFNNGGGGGLRSSGGSMLSSAQLSQAIRSGRQGVANFTNTRFASPVAGSAAGLHARFQRQASNEVTNVGLSGLLLPLVAKELANDQNSIGLRQFGGRQGGDNSAVNFGEPAAGREAVFGNACAQAHFCQSGSPYRTVDGSCNNLRVTAWGKSDTALNRLIKPQYDDGISLPRSLSAGSGRKRLPSARRLSFQLAKDSDNPDVDHTVITMAFGQFIDHDLTHVPIMSSGNGADIDCCRTAGTFAGESFSDVCSPISVPRDDPFFVNKQCMNLVRSTPAPSLDCNIQYREQLNQVTHWLDLSQVYGSRNSEANEVRAFRNGRLLVSGGSDGDLLPTESDGGRKCRGRCFIAGDTRVNEQPGLILLHTVFMREHNRIADRLSQINPGWSDERVYQGARRINVAQYQHIVYNEWLPRILGKRYMGLFGLYPLGANSGYSRDYDASIDPRINNEFAAAGFRFGHSLIGGLINVYSRVGNSLNPSIQLKDVFLRPEIMRTPGMMNGLVAGLTRDSMQQFDSSFTEDITRHLFDGDRNGMDLVAINIQRGRDHGLPGYNHYRDLCKLGRAQSFGDLGRHMALQRVNELQGMYDSVDDIDLFVGMFSERPMRDALVGPVTLCIVGDQFARLKKGDRYFYELSPQLNAGGFSLNQLGEIRKSSLARILCDNTGISLMQPLAFLTPTSFNPVIGCSLEQSVPRPDLNQWRESFL